VVEGALVAMRCGAEDQFQPVGRHGQGEGHGVVGVSLGHGPGRQDDDLVHDRPHRGVGLRPPDDDAVLPAVHNPDVKVRVLLLVGTLASLPFDVRLGHGEAEVPGAAAVEHRGDARGVVRPFCLVQVVGDHRQANRASEPMALMMFRTLRASSVIFSISSVLRRRSSVFRAKAKYRL